MRTLEKPLHTEKKNQKILETQRKRDRKISLVMFGQCSRIGEIKKKKK
jgi:predicted nucleic acid-binding Zn ribbon protein